MQDALGRAWTVLSRWRAPLLAFAAGQPAVQLVNLATGLLLVRWMTTKDYAQFGVAFAFQSTVAMLADLGFSSAILALAGTNGTNPEVIGRYIRSAKSFRRFQVVVVGIAFIVAFPLITRRQDWTILEKVLLLASILVAVVVQEWNMYRAPLLAHRQLDRLYKPQVSSSVIRLGASAMLHLANLLTGVVASWISTASLALNGCWTKCSAKSLVKEPPTPDPATSREMRRYLLPLMPGLIFTAFQSHIAVAIIAFAGSTTSVAEVVALGRLAQLFAVLTAFNGVIIGPLFAATNRSKLPRNYLLVLGVAGISATLISVMALGFPSFFLWVLGPRYSNLEIEVGWIVIASSLSYFAGVLWTISAARKWVFWWTSVVYIPAILLAQFLAAMALDLSTTLGVVQFSCITAAANVVAHAITPLYLAVRRLGR